MLRDRVGMARHVPMLPTAPTWLRDVPLAHRGLHGDGIAENTLPAFEAAARAGVGVELDVQRSRDGVPVVVHDPQLERVAGHTARVADLDAAQLAGLPIGGQDGGVPRLAEALELLVDVPVMVEIKNLTAAATLLDPAVAAALARHPGPVCVASFHPRTLEWFRHHAPQLPRVQTAGLLEDVPMPALLRWSLRTLRWLQRVQPCAVSYELAGIDHSAVQAYRAAGGTVVAWTVASEDDLAQARRHADNLVFEALPIDAVRGGVRTS